MRKIVLFILLAVLVLVASVYFVVQSVIGSLKVDIPLDGIRIKNPLLDGSLEQGKLSGTVQVDITNTSAYTITLDHLFLKVYLQDGALLGDISEPLQAAINAGATSHITVNFKIDVAGIVNAIWSVIGGGAQLNVIGYASYLNVFRVPIKKSVGLKIK